MQDISPRITQLTIYPVKSLDGVNVEKARIGNGGSLQHDREFAIQDSNGKFVNGKSEPLVHLLRAAVDFTEETISFRRHNETSWQLFSLQQQTNAINTYLSVFFGKQVTLHRNISGGFLDIPVYSGVTVVSTQSLRQVCNWFAGLPLDECRRRFRATIEIDHVPAFWEDRLFSLEGTAVEFMVGDVCLYGMAPRARCVVPSRQPDTGEVTYGFQKYFAGKRLNELPDWSVLQEYGHSYYLSVDCYIPPAQRGKWIHVGDALSVTGKTMQTGELW